MPLSCSSVYGTYLGSVPRCSTAHMGDLERSSMTIGGHSGHRRDFKSCVGPQPLLGRPVVAEPRKTRSTDTQILSPFREDGKGGAARHEEGILPCATSETPSTPGHPWSSALCARRHGGARFIRLDPWMKPLFVYALATKARTSGRATLYNPLVSSDSHLLPISYPVED